MLSVTRNDDGKYCLFNFCEVWGEWKFIHKYLKWTTPPQTYLIYQQYFDIFISCTELHHQLSELWLLNDRKPDATEEV